ncbi:MAG TPA: Smr/MutS family protein [Pyrinomonadaceae bacterium]|jgi:dsDNA-specific endonuclease/ATPase MutS2|nr:Smr/MutS family protein [Pyrinomonadaceae bacterium]
MSFRDWIKRLFGSPALADGAAQAEQLSEGDKDDGVDPFNPFSEPVRLEISDVFDLHTVAPREVKAVVEAYLAEAHAAGFQSVRIIHGKGKGVQREMVRAILARTPFVLDYTDAPPDGGGWGATVAHLSQKVKAE